MKKVCIIGGGAAGHFAAIRIAEYAQQLNKKVKIKILESSSQTLKKVRISGGGRCNVTHHIFDTKNFSQNYPRGKKELLSPFQTFQAKDTVEWFKDKGIHIVPEQDGRMFPSSNKSETIINCFQDELQKFKIEVLLNHLVESVEKDKEKGNFILKIKNKETMIFDHIVLATGSSPGGYSFAESLGHKITDRAPSLFSFKLKHELLNELEGLSFKTTISKVKTSLGKKFEEQGPCLITHWGLSGPAILKISAWAARDMKNSNYKGTLYINWLGLKNADMAMKLLIDVKNSNLKSLLKNSYPEVLPKRFWMNLLSSNDVDSEKRWADISKKELNKLTEALFNSAFEILGKNRFKDEFVECGGVSLKEINFKTMESKICPGLYVIGELLDIDGITGGFNFQSAWTTGWIAGSHLASEI